MTSIWFVTPAWKRFDLSAVCFEQQRQALDVLRDYGYDAQSVVIANDENLDLARGQRFHVVEQSNETLGRKFNDGFQYAAEHGADWFVPIGSDSWIDPRYFLPLPPDNKNARMSKVQSIVTRKVVAEINRSGGGPHMLHRKLLEPKRFRPAEDYLKRGIDRSILEGIGRSRIFWQPRDIAALQYVGFRGSVYLTSVRALLDHAYATHTNRAEVLINYGYDPALVERALQAQLSTENDEGRGRLGIPASRRGLKLSR